MTTEEATETFKLTFPPRVAEFVTRHYEAADTILEYGSGGSTVLAARLGKRIVSVESDGAWAARLQSALAAEKLSAEVRHVDIGPTQEWGYPADTGNWGRFWKYPLEVWDADGFAHPDLVLIDGRMRLACLAAVALRITQPTRVLFDDYANRKRYHRAEGFFTPTKTLRRMAVFDLTPGMIPPERMHEIIPWFFAME